MWEVRTVPLLPQKLLVIAIKPFALHQNWFSRFPVSRFPKLAITAYSFSTKNPEPVRRSLPTQTSWQNGVILIWMLMASSLKVTSQCHNNSENSASGATTTWIRALELSNNAIDHYRREIPVKLCNYMSVGVAIVEGKTGWFNRGGNLS